MKIARVILPLLLVMMVYPAAGQPIHKSKCDSVPAAIKEFARNDVENSDGPQLSLIIELYGKNTCLSRDSAIHIYVNEYHKIKQAGKTPFGMLVPGMGWLVAFMLLFILAFQEFLKKKLTALLNAIGLLFRKKLAGSKLANRMALKKYKKALQKKYRKIYIPFRPNRPLNMDEVYIPLKSSDGSYEIDLLNAVRENERAVVVGVPGSGKSMLCKHIVYSYGRGNYHHISVLIELHRMNNKEATVLSLITDELSRNDFPYAKSFVTRSLKNNSLLLLFDGFDEIGQSDRQRVVRLLKDFIAEYKCAKFIITCRTAVYQQEFADCTEKLFHIAEFNTHQMRLFFRSWGPAMPPDKSTNQLMSTLLDRPQLMSLATNPLMLTIISYLYTDTPHILPHSRGEFYQIATEVLLNQWHREANCFKAIEKAYVLQHLALVNQDDARETDSDRKVLKYTRVLEEIRKVLPLLNLPPESDKHILSEIVERSGLLIQVDGGAFFQFTHLTMQEYFAARQLITDEDGLVERFRGDPVTWRESVKLWCGITNDATSFIDKIFRIDKTAAFECLAEANKVLPGQAEQIIQYFSGQLGMLGPGKELLTKAFGSVASDIRPRGLRLFTWLEEQLVLSCQREELSDVIKSLSYTYLPKAAVVLATTYRFNKFHDEIHEAFLRMGDIAVPAIADLIRNREDAMNFLRDIKTPDAAGVLLSFIWENTGRAFMASFFLSEMLSLPNIEESLRNYPLSPAHKKMGYLDWVWQPFNEPSTSSLPLIAGRIVYLLAENGLPLDERRRVFLRKGDTANMDIRIAIPLSIERTFYFSRPSFCAAVRKRLESDMFDDNVFPGKDAKAFINHVETNLSLEQVDLIKDCVHDLLHRLEVHHGKKAAKEFVLDIYGHEDIAWCLFQSLSPEISIDLAVLNLSQRLDAIDWEQALQPQEYNFRNSWHCKLTIGILSSITLLCAWFLYRPAPGGPLPVWCLRTVAVLLIASLVLSVREILSSRLLKTWVIFVWGILVWFTVCMYCARQLELSLSISIGGVLMSVFIVGLLKMLRLYRRALTPLRYLVSKTGLLS